MKIQCAILLLIAIAIDAFTVQPVTYTPTSRAQRYRQVQFMANDPEEKAKSGDIYDDEVEAYKDPLSDGMRAKLMREASTGLDSEQKQSNVILYISAAVVVLVLLGGQGILF
mmetsp:Transcript_21131/g.30938  ORF Transcript_21131/g.30938 Transcript_21131/m.30938 type:complete len:112 (+) Transcript_21131:91-426(+)|eukprot:CAMPEP_0197247580 /NCGR_PEP_ID=MMETSP1429-20130617/29419_1 /TAXON_ID=49237 /ORGANISM="Chaetoceros  sp., Strain UNC1202" /LENGTH=111 /DNA_ID=CAMNT_0042708519 /DNA_START=91 /DNA_END=426 /DNA_ORIENTATION=+